MAVSDQLERFEEMLTRLGNSPEDTRLAEEVAAVLAYYEGPPSPERVKTVMVGVRYGVKTLQQLRDLGLHLTGPNHKQMARALVHQLDAQLLHGKSAGMPAWLHDMFVQELRAYLPAAANHDIAAD